MSAAQSLPASYPERLLSPLVNFHLAMDVALGVDEDTILDAYNLQGHEYELVIHSGIFQQQLRRVEEQLEKDGGSFKLKAQAQAEVLLKEAFSMAMDRDMDPKVRADMIKQNVRWAGFDNPNPEGQGGTGGFHVTMNFNAEHTPTTITYDQEGNAT